MSNRPTKSPNILDVPIKSLLGAKVTSSGGYEGFVTEIKLKYSYPTKCFIQSRRVPETDHGNWVYLSDLTIIEEAP